MKQVTQSLETGALAVADVPTPVLRPEGILVRTAASLVSAGTERTVVEFAEKNLLQKARARPDLARQILEKVRREGLLTTIENVRGRLAQPMPLGYSSAGVVTHVGREATGFHAGDRVACAGAGYATHAEIAYVPRTLAVTLPDAVSFESAAFTTLGAIALQGIRQAKVVVGHQALVIGLGLLGQLSIQLLKAAGCRVLGIDLNLARVARARDLGADAACAPDAAVATGRAFTAGRGFDAILITADTRRDEPVALAGELARDRAIVVAVGNVSLRVPRKLYYEKELDLRLSRSYGPGRYDPEYEEKGHDYPYGYVRWTEQRNMEAFVQLLAAGAVRVEPLITHRFPISEAARAYDLITGKSDEPFLGVVLTYDPAATLPRRIDLPPRTSERLAPSPAHAAVRLGMVGAGSFTNTTLLPAMRGLQGLERVGIVSGSGLTARTAADRFGFTYCASDIAELLADGRINWLAIATRHNLHAAQAIAALRSGKDVFVEKPLALGWAQLVDVLRAQQETGRRLVVGFNRRFAPMVVEARRFLANRRRPLVATYRVNAGHVPPMHWTRDPGVGGGRIVGEACHFVDLLQFLVGAPTTSVNATAIRERDQLVEDEAIVTLTFADGSVGAIVYAAGGDRSFGKERLEVIGDDRVAVLDDFRRLELIHDGKRSGRREWLRTSKGHREEWEAIVAAAQAGIAGPIPLEEIVATHLATFAAVDSLRQGVHVAVNLAGFWADVNGPGTATTTPA